jgi:hypothetical protein
MSNVTDLHQNWMKSKEYRKAHEELVPEFALARAIIEARVTAGLTQEELARRNPPQSQLRTGGQAFVGLERTRSRAFHVPAACGC